MAVLREGLAPKKARTDGMVRELEDWLDRELEDIQTELEPLIQDVVLSLHRPEPKPEEPLQFYVLKHRAHHEMDHAVEWRIVPEELLKREPDES